MGEVKGGREAPRTDVRNDPPAVRPAPAVAPRSRRQGRPAKGPQGAGAATDWQVRAAAVGNESQLAPYPLVERELVLEAADRRAGGGVELDQVG